MGVDCAIRPATAMAVPRLTVTVNKLISRENHSTTPVEGRVVPLRNSRELDALCRLLGTAENTSTRHNDAAVVPSRPLRGIHALGLYVTCQIQPSARLAKSAPMASWRSPAEWCRWMRATVDPICGLRYLMSTRKVVGSSWLVPT